MCVCVCSLVCISMNNSIYVIFVCANIRHIGKYVWYHDISCKFISVYFLNHSHSMSNGDERLRCWPEPRLHGVPSQRILRYLLHLTSTNATVPPFYRLSISQAALHISKIKLQCQLNSLLELNVTSSACNAIQDHTSILINSKAKAPFHAFEFAIVENTLAGEGSKEISI